MRAMRTHEAAGSHPSSARLLSRSVCSASPYYVQVCDERICTSSQPQAGHECCWAATCVRYAWCVQPQAPLMAVTTVQHAPPKGTPRTACRQQSNTPHTGRVLGHTHKRCSVRYVLHRTREHAQVPYASTLGMGYCLRYLRYGACPVAAAGSVHVNKQTHQHHIRHG